MVGKESDRGRKRGTWPRRNFGDRMWCSEGFFFFFFLQSFAVCCVESALLSVSPWPMVKSTSRRTRYNAKSVWGKGQSVEITANGREKETFSESARAQPGHVTSPSCPPGILASKACLSLPSLPASASSLPHKAPLPTFPKLCPTLCCSTSAGKSWPPCAA